MQTQQQDYIHEDEKDEVSCGVETISLDPDAPELPPLFKPDSTPPLPLPVYREIRTEIPTGDVHEDEKNEASCEIETISLDPDAPELPPPFKPDSTPPRPLPVYQEIHNEIPARESNECTDNSALVVCSDTPSHPKPPLPISSQTTISHLPGDC